ncbi:MAG: phosphoribosylformylglycinamidine cyclo-ligase, partial [Planctomycetaceae bacterium]|nr:phosphoribosylformylglycinamidine cyclo-ligase [Planctomycetaceae bacterium]
VRVTIDRSTWTPPACFDWLAKLGPVEREEMFRVFNMGIGFVIIADPNSVEHVVAALGSQDAGVNRIGHVDSGTRGVDLKN